MLVNSAPGLTLTGRQRLWWGAERAALRWTVFCPCSAHPHQQDRTIRFQCTEYSFQSRNRKKMFETLYNFQLNFIKSWAQDYSPQLIKVTKTWFKVFTLNVWVNGRDISQMHRHEGSFRNLKKKSEPHWGCKRTPRIQDEPNSSLRTQCGTQP